MSKSVLDFFRGVESASGRDDKAGCAAEANRTHQHMTDHQPPNPPPEPTPPEQITGDSPGPPREETAQTIASIEAQLDDLLDAIDHHEALAGGAPTAKAPQASAIPAPQPDLTPTEAEALDAMNAALSAPDAPAPSEPPEHAPPPAPEPPAESGTDAEIEALLAEQAIDPEVLEAAQTIAAQDAEQAEASRAALEARAQDAAQSLDVEAMPTLDPPEAGVPEEKTAQAMTDAAIEDLIAEQPVEDEVLAVASEIAQRDAESAAGGEATAFADSPGFDTEIEGDTETQEQIAAEIEQLLAAEGHDVSVPALESAPEAEAMPEPDPSIDQIDQMLAAEIDTDEELAGDFQSVEDIAGDIAPEDAGGSLEPGGASASDVAGELDSQPEDAIPVSAAQAEHNEEEEARGGRRWKPVVRVAERAALHACWLANWPARQFLTPQWRATVGYIALVNLAGGVALFAVGLAKLVM